MKIKQKLKLFFHISGYLALFLLIVANFLSLSFPVWGRLGTCLWVLSFIYFLIFLIKSWLTIFKHKYYPIFTILVLLLFSVFIFKSIPKMISYNGESSQEIACALYNIDNYADYGYNKTCLYGYPSRQYLVPALPSLIFGRSLISLNTGGSIYLILGLLIFSSNALKYLKFSRHGDLITALVLGSLLHFHFFNYFAFVFEQSIFPFSFGLIIAGLVLDYLNNENKFPKYLFGFCFFYLAYSYTPSLALIPLLMFFLAQNIKKNENKSWISWVIIILIPLIILPISFIHRTDINFFDQTSSLSIVFSDISKGFYHLFINTIDESYVTQFMFPFFVLLILLPIFRPFGFFSIVIFIWTLLTIVMSILSKGLMFYPVFFRVHRSIIIIPILITYLIYFIKEREIKINQRWLGVLLFLVIIFGSINFFSETIGRNKEEQLIISTIELVKEMNKEPDGLIILANGNDDDYYKYPTLVDYFLPGTTSYFYKTDKYCSLPYGNMYLISKTNQCFESYNQKFLANNKDKVKVSILNKFEQDLYLFHLDD